MKKKILAAVLAAARVKELPLFMELPDIVKKWEMQD